MTNKRLSDSVRLIKEITSAPECIPKLLVICPDQTRRTRIVDMILEKFLPGYKAQSALVLSKTSAPMGLQRFDLSENSVSMLKVLKEELSSFSLFAPDRFLVVSAIDALENAELSALKEICENMPARTHLLMCARKLAGSSILYKSLHKAGALIELEELKGYETKRWIERELKRLGIVNYPEKLPELVSELGQQDPDEIIKLLEQLALYADSPEVSSADIKQLFSHDEVKSEFEFIDCLMNRNAARAEILIENLFQHGKSPFMLLALLAKNFATFIAIKALSDQGRTPHEIRQRLGLAPWLFGKHQSAVRTFSQAQLRRGLHAIMRADSKLKNRSVGQEAIFSELVYAIGRS